MVLVMDRIPLAGGYYLVKIMGKVIMVISIVRIFDVICSPFSLHSMHDFLISRQFESWKGGSVHPKIPVTLLSHLTASGRASLLPARKYCRMQ